MTKKKRILFVDDEPAILEALENLLHKDRDRWDLVFTANGAAALLAIRAEPFDVVVSDMRMPELDGAALLKLVKDECPGTVRIMLSGQADRAAITRALPALHQLVSKPCNGRSLRDVLERSLYGRDAATDDRIAQLIGAVDKLPTPSDIYFDLNRLMQSPTSSIADFAKVVGRDPALSAKVLQLVNSSFFSTGRPTTSIQQAVSRLGTEQLRYIALTASVFSAVVMRKNSWFSLQDLQRGSMRAAWLAREIAEPAARDEVFAATLLHNVGHIVLSLGRSPEVDEFCERMTVEPERELEVELELLGVGHAEIGAQLLARWGVPMAIVDVVRFHRDPGSAPQSARRLASIVHVANVVSPSLPTVPKLDTESLQRAGCAELVPAWLETARRTLNNPG